MVDNNGLLNWMWINWMHPHLSSPSGSKWNWVRHLAFSLPSSQGSDPAPMLTRKNASLRRDAFARASGCSSASLLNASSLPQQSFSSSWNPGASSIFFSDTKETTVSGERKPRLSDVKHCFPHQGPLQTAESGTRGAYSKNISSSTFSGPSPCEAVTNLQEWQRMTVEGAWT